MESRHWLIAMNLVPGLGGVLFSRLTRAFGNPEQVFSASSQRLMEVEGIGPVLSERIANLEPEKEVAKEIKQAEVQGIGMARGIDSLAHQSALKAGGRTLAVLGSGLDRIYPPENRPLSEAIVSSGALISEFPLATSPEPGNFPARNRLISGLALGTVVIEAAQKSGSLITAQYSVEQGREVFAVPGNANSPTSAGTNRLIQRGAKLVTSAEDVIEELPEPAKPFLRRPVDNTAQSAGDLGGIEKQIYELLFQGHKHIDALIEESRAEAGPVSAALASLELKGLVKQFEGKVFARP